MFDDSISLLVARSFRDFDDARALAAASHATCAMAASATRPDSARPVGAPGPSLDDLGATRRAQRLRRLAAGRAEPAVR
jgi:hypothetical protein